MYIYVYMCVYYVIYFTSKIISSNFSTFMISLSKTVHSVQFHLISSMSKHSYFNA